MSEITLKLHYMTEITEKISSDLRDKSLYVSGDTVVSRVLMLHRII